MTRSESGSGGAMADRFAAWLPAASMRRVRDVLRSAFWLVPALCVCASIGLGIGLIVLDDHLPSAHGVFLYPGPPAGARSFLSSIVTAMISFTGLVFSITILVLQLTSGQFSPRVLRMFLRDRTSQFTLGVFVATFVYAMVVQRAVRGTGAADARVPRIAVTVAFAFVLASVGLFIRYISHIANMIRVATIIDTIARESRVLLDRLYPLEQPAERPSEPVAPVSRIVPAPDPGVVVSVNEAALTGLARQADCVIAVRQRVGDFVPAGAPLFAIHGEVADPAKLASRMREQVALDTERTMEQDLAFGFRQLIDIAERALSPGINDPTTACQAVDALHDLLRRLVTRPHPPVAVRDEDDRLRVLVPRYRFADLLDLTIGEIWHYGAEAAQVPARLAGMRADLSFAARPEHRFALAQWAHILTTGAAQAPTRSDDEAEWECPG